MTIAEHLQTQIRTCNRIKWVGGLTVLLVTAHQVYLKHYPAGDFADVARAKILASQKSLDVASTKSDSGKIGK